jgi:hypothetical protein
MKHVFSPEAVGPAVICGQNLIQNGHQERVEVKDRIFFIFELANWGLSKQGLVLVRFNSLWN